MKNKFLLILTTGHLFTDLNQGALPAMLPFLIAAGGLKYAEAAGLTFAVALTSSLTQPVFGFLADRISKSWLLPLGVLLAGCGLSLIGFFPSHYWIMFGAAMISGVGIAAYHPEGARMANRLSGEKKAGTMSIFTVGGSIGIATGPLIITPALLHLGLRGSAVLAIPAVFMCITLFFLSPRMSILAQDRDKKEKEAKGELKNEWLKFLWLSVAIISRSIIGHSMNIFIPLYWVNVLLQSKATSGMVLSFMVFIGSITIIIGGQLADRFGINKIIRIGWILLIPSVFFLTRVSNPIFLLLMLVPISTGNYMVNTPLIVLGQKYLPKNIGFASGVTMGLAVSIGGVVAPLLGRYADINGLTAALRLLCILPIIGTVVAFTSKPPANG